MVSLQIVPELGLHDLGRDQQSHLAKPCGLLLLRRRVDDFDVVGLLRNASRHRLGRALAGDAGHLFLHLLDVLQIDRSDD